MARPLTQRFRRAWRELIGAGSSESFKGAMGGRLTADWNPTLQIANEESRWAMTRLRARARDLARNNSYARQYLNLLSVNVVGPHGVTYQSQVRDNSGDLNRALNDRIEAAWREWSETASLDGRWSRVALEHQSIETCARDGEAILRLWRGPDVNRFGFALEPIDPDLLDETNNRPAAPGVNEIRLGIEVDSKSRPVAYHFRERRRSGYSSEASHLPARVPADEIIHLGRATRVNQTRFLTWFAPVMLPMHMLAGYTEAELVAARTAAAKMGFFTKKDDQSGAVPPEGDSNGDIVMDASPGTFDFAPEGYELTPWDPDHPSTAFPEFCKAMLRDIATGLSCSYNTLSNNLEDVNYSSMRSGLLIERDMWRVLQTWWISSLLRPVFREWLTMALLSGALKLDSRDPRKFLEGSWTPRGWAWVDPMKDAQAGILAISAGLASRTTLLAEQGLDLETLLEQLSEENELAHEYGIDISGPKSSAPAADATSTSTNEPGKGVDPEDDAAGSAQSASRGRADVLAALANGSAERNGAGHPAAVKPPSRRRTR